MNDRDTESALQRKLETLRTDFAAVAGEPFHYFYCPILFVDDPTEICRAHLVNQAFLKTSRRWTVQRKDVDNFFGTSFEADFVELKGSYSPPIETLIAEGFSGRLRPKISYRGEKVEFYKPTSTVPPGHTEVSLDTPSGSIRLALKIEQAVLREARDEDWEFSIEKDCRLAALVSLIKTAHLTLFEMLGYRYALSAGGIFLGKTVLGDFFAKNRGLRREEVLHNAINHFREFQNLVRPIIAPSNTIEDTANDRIVYICEGSCRWAFLVYIRTGGLAHVVIVPQMESPDAAARFASFLTERGSKFQARRCYFDGDAFQAEPATKAFDWPAVTLE